MPEAEKVGDGIAHGRPREAVARLAVVGILDRLEVPSDGIGAFADAGEHPRTIVPWTEQHEDGRLPGVGRGESANWAGSR